MYQSTLQRCQSNKTLVKAQVIWPSAVPKVYPTTKAVHKRLWWGSCAVPLVELVPLSEGFPEEKKRVSEEWIICPLLAEALQCSGSWFTRCCLRCCIISRNLASTTCWRYWYILVPTILVLILCIMTTACLLHTLKIPYHLLKRECPIRNSLHCGKTH